MTTFSNKTTQTPASPAMTRFSFVPKPVTNKRPSREMTLSEVFDYISGPIAKERTAQLRAMTDKNARRTLKSREFDYVTFSGLFSYGSDNSLLQHSGLMCLDFDDLENTTSCKEVLLADPYFETQLLFTSPSGNGVKWVIDIDLREGDHREWFTAIRNYLFQTYRLQADPSGINVSRACFLPHDPEAYIRSKE
jgi:hypothetical protein